MSSRRPTAPAPPARLTRSVVALVVAKVVFALLGFSALVTEIATLVARGTFRAGDFFSYFTVEANLLAALSLLLSAFVVATGRRPAWFDVARGAVTFVLTTVILIFIVLLSGYPADTLTAVPWDNTVLHYIVPIVVILDWLVANRVAPIPFRTAATWLLAPLVYFVYSLVRGPIADWYPYPFMDPSTGGYGRVLVTAVIIAVVLAAIAWVVAQAPRWTGRWAVWSGPTAPAARADRPARADRRVRATRG